MLTGFGSCTYRGARTLTRTSELPRTPPYWSPEALRYLWRIRRRATSSYEARPSDDVYALGVMAYRLVTGTYPPAWAPQGNGVTQAERIEPERLVTVGSELAALIRRMQSQDPALRRPKVAWMGWLAAAALGRALALGEQRRSLVCGRPV